MEQLFIGGTASPVMQNPIASQVPYHPKLDKQNFHYIYDCLVVEITPSVFETSYAPRLQLRPILFYDETSPLDLERQKMYET